MKREPGKDAVKQLSEICKKVIHITKRSNEFRNYSIPREWVQKHNSWIVVTSRGVWIMSGNENRVLIWRHNCIRIWTISNKTKFNRANCACKTATQNVSHVISIRSTLTFNPSRDQALSQTVSLTPPPYILSTIYLIKHTTPHLENGNS